MLTALSEQVASLLRLDLLILANGGIPKPPTCAPLAARVSGCSLTSVNATPPVPTIETVLLRGVAFNTASATRVVADRSWLLRSFSSWWVESGSLAVLPNSIPTLPTMAVATEESMPSCIAAPATAIESTAPPAFLAMLVGSLPRTSPPKPRFNTSLIGFAIVAIRLFVGLSSRVKSTASRSLPRKLESPLRPVLAMADTAASVEKGSPDAAILLKTLSMSALVVPVARTRTVLKAAALVPITFFTSPLMLAVPAGKTKLDNVASSDQSLRTFHAGLATVVLSADQANMYTNGRSSSCQSTEDKRKRVEAATPLLGTIWQLPGIGGLSISKAVESKM